MVGYRPFLTHFSIWFQFGMPYLLYLKWFTHIFTEPEHMRFLILYEHAIIWIEYFPQQQQEELLYDWSTQYNTVIAAF